MNLGVLVSGKGTNLGALLAAQAAGALAPAQIVAVVSNRADAFALERAGAAGLPTAVVDHRAFASRADFDRALVAALAAHAVDAVVLAGFMRILTPTFLGAFPGRVINTHPALCPAFPGTDAPAQALAYGVKVTGVTVHFVDAGVDTGPIIAQRAVAVLATDDARSLHARIQAEEHRLLPAVVRALAAGRLVCDGRTVVIAPGPAGDADPLA